MKHYWYSIILTLIFQTTWAGCPVYKRHIPNNGIFYELGGAGMYHTAGYSLQLNGGYFYNYVISTNIGYSFCPETMNSKKPHGISGSIEFHGMTQRNGGFFIIAGIGMNHLTYTESTEPETTQRISHFSPMVGMEYMFRNRASVEFKYQPYTIAKHLFNNPDFNSLLGLKVRFFIGNGEYGLYGGLFRF